MHLAHSHLEVVHPAHLAPPMHLAHLLRTPSPLASPRAFAAAPGMPAAWKYNLCSTWEQFSC